MGGNPAWRRLFVRARRPVGGSAPSLTWVNVSPQFDIVRSDIILTLAMANMDQPHRPLRVICNDEALARALEPVLSALSPGANC